MAVFFAVVSKMVSNIDIFQDIVSKLEIPVSWQHYLEPYMEPYFKWYFRNLYFFPQISLIHWFENLFSVKWFQVCFLKYIFIKKVTLYFDSPL